MQISSNRCTHTTNNACKPMLMLHYNVQHHFPIAHMPSHILVDLGRGWFPLANVIFPKITVLDLLFLPLAYVNGTQPTDTRHGLLVHTLNNGAFNCLMTLATCSITTLDVWILCLFLPIVGRHHLIDACMLKQMSSSRFTEDTTNVFMPWRIFQSIWLVSPNWCM